MEKITKEIVIERLKDLNENLEFIGDFINVKTHSTFKCKKCGKTFQKRPMDIFRFPRCIYCEIITHKRPEGHYRKLLDNIFKKEKFEILTEDIPNNKTIVTIKHLECGMTFSAKAQYLIKKGKCLYCQGNVRKIKSISDVNFYVKNICNDEYSVIDKEYIPSKKLTLLHKTCGRQFKMNLGNFLSGQRCPLCAHDKRIEYCNSTRKTNEKFIKEIADLVGDEYTFLDKYINSRKKLLVKHKTCGKKYYVSPHDFLNGRRCPICKASHGEETISKYLDEKKYYFSREYSFESLGKKRFDFVIFNDENKTDIKCIIEYDGYFHWHNYGKNDGSLKRTRKSDRRKEDFCNKENYTLYRIPYWYEKDLESILNKILSQNIKVVMTSKIKEFSDVNFNFNDYPLETEMSQQE